MKKIIIIGSPGAGKSVFARKLRDASDLPLYHLDMLWHKPDRTNISPKEFDAQLQEILENDRWIIDGNYLRTMEIRIKACDTVFFLDYPLDVCLRGAKSRIGKQREDLPWVEEELDEEFLQWILDFPKEQRPQIYALIEKYQQKHIIIFRSRMEEEAYWIQQRRKNYGGTDKRIL